jgi:transcriptional regulator with XRE-family HTH domain
MISIRQLKAARALLGWSQADLAIMAGVSRPTIQRIESLDDGPVHFDRHSTAYHAVDALRDAGIEFLNDGQIGVTLLMAKRNR